jgi:hypothetical protein
MTANTALESLHPGNFALVMATGIISIALKAMNHVFLASLFAYMAVIAWIVLMFLCTLRLIKFHNAVVIDLTSPRMVFSYFTLVAATDIVGMLALHEGYLYVAYACWGIAFVAWCLLLYLAFSVLTFMSHENNVNIMHGGWLITIVGTQSLVLLGSELATTLGPYAHYMLVEVHLLWGLGLALYGIFVTLFCYRIFFLALKPHDLSPLILGGNGRGSNQCQCWKQLVRKPPYYRLPCYPETFYQRHHLYALVLGYMVGSATSIIRYLETLGQGPTLRVRTHCLEYGFSFRHVFAGKPAFRRADRFSTNELDRTHHDHTCT